MNFAIKLKTAPSSEPISTADAKKHLRIEDVRVDDNDYIDALVVVVRSAAEEFLCRALITQTWTYTADDFPGGCSDGYRRAYSRIIELPRPPLVSVSSVKYRGRTDAIDTSMDSAFDAGTNLHTMSSSLYEVDSQSEPGRISPIPTGLWPYTRLPNLSPSMNNVSIEYVAGYGSAATAIPSPIIFAMKLMLGHLYENRESVLTGARAAAIEVPGAKDLLWPYRIVGFP